MLSSLREKQQQQQQKNTTTTTPPRRLFCGCRLVDFKHFVFFSAMMAMEFLASASDQGDVPVLHRDPEKKQENNQPKSTSWGHAKKYLYETLKKTKRVKYCKMLLYCYPYYVVSYRFFKKNVKFFHTMCVVSIALHFLQKPPYIKKKEALHLSCK